MIYTQNKYSSTKKQKRITAIKSILSPSLLLVIVGIIFIFFSVFFLFINFCLNHYLIIIKQFTKGGTNVFQYPCANNIISSFQVINHLIIFEIHVNLILLLQYYHDNQMHMILINIYHLLFLILLLQHVLPHQVAIVVLEQ